MLRGRLVALLGAGVLALGGCLGGADEPEAPAPSTAPTEPTAPAPVDAGVPAPWWDVGEYWDVELTYKGATKKYRLVNFWNDSESAHFWLGVNDRALALDHAMYDTNPFLGRLHWEILAPHESGMHAVMYGFPLKDGNRWRGPLLAGDWESEARADPARPGAFLVTGRGADGATIAYDFDPTTRWFSSIEIQSPSGEPTLRAVVTAHGTGESGTFHFLRGRDYYAGPEVRTGPHTETVTVEDEALDALAFDLQISVDAPLVIEILDPSGTVRDRQTVASPLGGELRGVVELPSPAKGDWSVRFITAGTIEGTITGTGLFETQKAI